MLLKIVKTSTLVALTACTLSANSFNTQAQKDKKELIKYFEAKFANPEKNAAEFFPYSTKYELKNGIKKGIKHEEFAKGNYAYDVIGLQTYTEMKDMPPYDDAIDAGEELYNKKFKNGNSLSICFPDPTIGGDYPMFDESKKAVVTITQAVNDCLTANGEKAWNTKKGNMANFEGFIASKTQEAKKKVNIKIQSAAAAAAYERGKKYYYTQRGYLNLSCATCHVQGAGKRVRNEYLHPLLGASTHFPVWRLKWNSLGTLERRMGGCIKDTGQVPPKPTSQTTQELIYFIAYMSNGMGVDGPDLRK